MQSGLLCVGKLQPPPDAPLGYRSPSGIAIGKEMQLCVCSSLYIWCVDLLPATAYLTGLQASTYRKSLFFPRLLQHFPNPTHVFSSVNFCRRPAHVSSGVGALQPLPPRDGHERILRQQPYLLQRSARHVLCDIGYGADASDSRHTTSGGAKGLSRGKLRLQALAVAAGYLCVLRDSLRLK
jgi:hypothetical protein